MKDYFTCANREIVDVTAMTRSNFIIWNISRLRIMIAFAVATEFTIALRTRRVESRVINDVASNYFDPILCLD